MSLGLPSPMIFKNHVALKLVEELLAFVVVVILAVIRTTHHHDDELRVLEDQFVADRRFEQRAVLVDPFPEVERLELSHGILASVDGRDAFQLDSNRRREPRNADRCPAGLIVFEILGIEPVVGGKVLFQVGQEHGDVHQIVPV